MKTSNKFTLSRMILAPIIFLIYYLPQMCKVEVTSVLSVVSIVATIVILIYAELTDAFDGYYARKENTVSDFGKMFDPFADVFLHLSMFTCFTIAGYMPVIFYVLIFYREFAQNFLRMVSAKSGVAIAAKKGGKVKTCCYVASCFVVLLQELLIRTGLSTTWSLNMEIFKFVGYGFFGLSVILAWASFIDYLKSFGKVLKEQL